VSHHNERKHEITQIKALMPMSLQYSLQFV